MPQTGSFYGEGVYGTDEYGAVGFIVRFIPAVYGTAVYGDSIYGADEVGVKATGAVTTVTVAADANVLPSGVSADIITDDPVVIGDEVTVDAEAVVDATAVEGTGVVNDPIVSLPTVIPAPSVSASILANPLGPVSVTGTGEVGDALVITGKVVTTLPAVTATGATTTTIIDAKAVAVSPGVSGTGQVETASITTTTNIFQAADRTIRRQVYVPSAPPRTVFVKAA